jgi:hypothetical protein
LPYFIAYPPIRPAEERDDSSRENRFRDTRDDEMREHHRRDRHSGREGTVERRPVGEVVEKWLKTELDRDEKRRDIDPDVSARRGRDRETPGAWIRCAPEQPENEISRKRHHEAHVE